MKVSYRLRRALPAVAVALVLVLCYPWRGASPPESDGVEEIRFMYPRGSLTGAMARAIGEFELESRRAHERDPSLPVYRVIAGQHAERSGLTRFLLSVAGGDPPDVFYGERGLTADWVARGAFRPLDDLIAADAEAGLPDAPRPERYYPGCWESVVYDGHVYAVPMGVGNAALVYNKALLEREGLVYDAGPERGAARPPSTWEEVREYVRRLERRSDDGDRALTVVGLDPLRGAGSLELYTNLAGGRLLADSGRRSELGGAEAEAALTFVRDLYAEQGGAADVRSLAAGPPGSASDPLLTGKLAMAIEYQWVVNWQAAISPDLRLGVAPLPAAGRGGAPRSWATGVQASIPAGARNPRGGWALIRFLGSDRGLELLAEYQRRLTEANGRLYVPTESPVPAVNERLTARYVTGNTRLPGEVRGAFEGFRALLPDARYAPISPVYNLLASAETRATERALYGAAPRTALDESAPSVQAELDRAFGTRGSPAPPAGGLAAGLCAAAAAVAALVGARRRRAPRTASAPGRGGWGAAMIAPWLAGFLVFTAWPVLVSLYLSFCDADALRAPSWVGWRNFADAFRDASLRRAVWNTLAMTAAIPPSLVVSLALALLLDQPVRLRAVWRSAVYLPVVVPLVASSLAWVWFLNPRGPLDRALGAAGLAAPNWLLDPAWSKPALAVVAVWMCGSSVVVWLAGLRTIPVAEYEAAALDGANAWQRLRHVTWPHLSPYFFFNLLAGLLAAFQSFGESFVMTAGGPDESTLFYNYYLFDSAFRFGRLGYASALAWIQFAVLVALAALQFRMVKRWRRS